MEPSVAQAHVMVDELVRCGVHDVVLAPGSRSAPLALVLSAAERAGQMHLHVRIDERTAGYLALGLAKASASPVAVVTTSGTAAVNLHPAIVEAHESGIPLLALTADRPGPLRQVGANQAIDQVGLFGSAVRTHIDVAVMSTEGDTQLRTAVRYWRSTIARAVGACVDPANPGPVQVNLPFAEPLVPSIGALRESPLLEGRPDERPWTVDGRMFASMSVTLDDVLADAGWLGAAPSRGLILVGDLGGYADHAGGEIVELIGDLAEGMGWPIIGEPSGNVSGCSYALAHGPLLLGSAQFAASMVPEFVLTVGRLGLTRSVLRVIAQATCHVTVSSRALWFDPTRSADLVVSAVPLPGTPAKDSDWLAQWQRADVLAAAAIETATDRSVFTGIDVARHCATGVPDGGLLFLGASWSVRHVASFAGRSSGQAYVLGNRGTSGIDGSLATAYGAAFAYQREDGGPAIALVGDLAFRYDDSALMTPASEQQPDLVIVVSDNDGGGIFSQLEQSQPQFAEDFERVFGTPVRGDVAELARACGLPVQVVSTDVQFQEALADALDAGGLQVVVARTCSRGQEAEMLVNIQAAVAEAVGSPG